MAVGEAGTTRPAPASTASAEPRGGERLDVSVVLPAYHEAESLRETLADLLVALRDEDLSFEIVVVDDGSTDGTADVAEGVGTRFPGLVRVISHPYNKGNGAAVSTGIRAARGEVIACMDADGQHDPTDLRRALSHVGMYDLVVGARAWARYRGGWHRNLANRFYSWVASRLTDFPVEDLTSGFRVFRAEAVREFVDLFPARFSYPTTSTLAFLKAGYNVKYIPVHVRRRRGDSSKIRVMRDGWGFLVIIFKIVVLFEPLRIFLPSALLLLTLGLVSTIIATLSLGRLYIPNSGVLLFVVSVVVMLLGLMAEQIATLQIVSRKRLHDEEHA